MDRTVGEASKICRLLTPNWMTATNLNIIEPDQRLPAANQITSILASLVPTTITYCLQMSFKVEPKDARRGIMA